MPGTWRPILTGSLADEALAVARAIGDELADLEAADSPLITSPSLAGGYAGIALLHAYLDACFPEEEHRERALSAVERALEDIEKVLGHPALYGGYIGVAWALAHLELHLWQSGEVDDLQPLDEALSDLLSGSFGGDYDLISGLVGFAVYALERPDSALLGATLTRIIDLLDKAAERPQAESDAAAWATWKTAPELLPLHQRRLAPDGYYNLGMAHGVPGIVAVLGQACAVSDSPPRTRALVRQALDWFGDKGLLPGRTSSTANATASSIGSWLIPGQPMTPSRTAWCYGDAGVAIAFLQGAQALDDAAMYRHAVDIGLRAAARELASSGVRDAPICHGAAGLGHLFNRLYQATGESGFLDSAQRWFKQVLAMRQPGRGVAGFLSYMPPFDRKTGRMLKDENGEEPADVWESDPGLLTGAAGIGLTLLAAVTPIEPLWDRHLLCAVPPRG